MKVRDRRQEQLRSFGELFDRAVPNGGKVQNTFSLDITARKHKGNEQSISAFHVIKDKISHEQTKILILIAGHPDGITVDEIAQRYQKTPNQVSGRVSELKRMGKIYKSGTRKTRSGCSAAILKAL